MFNLLQILAWAAAGYAVGAGMRWLRARRGWRAALSLGPGMWLVWAGYVAVPLWLQVEGPRWLDPPWLPAQVVLAGLVVWGVDGLVGYLRQPIVVRRRASGAPASSTPPGRRAARPSRRAHDPMELLTRWRQGDRDERRAAKGRDQEDIIMIELD